MSDVTVFVPPGTTASVVEGAPPPDLSAEVAGLNADLTAANAEITALQSQIVLLTPKPPTPIVQLVRPSLPLTDAVFADRSLAVGWKKSTGDWFDADGVLNGPKPTVTGNGTSATIDTTAFDDLMIVTNSISKVVIDDLDVSAQCFWTDPTSNHALALPSHYGRPVIVPDPVGKSLTFNSSGGAWRVDPLAMPTAAVPAVLPGYTPPNILRINPTSFDAVVIPGSIPAASTAYNKCFGDNRLVTYETDRGVPFAKAHCPAIYYPTTGAGRVARCDYPITPTPSLYVAYLLYIGPEVWDAVMDLGVKLSGMGGSEGRWNIGEHSGRYYSAPKNARNRPLVTLRDYFYSAEATSGQGAGNGQQSPKAFGFLRSPGWSLIEHGAVANTFNEDGTANADGLKISRINGTLVEKRTIKWFSTPGSLWQQMSLQIYHGGTASYGMNCWYGVGPFMASTTPIGVDPQFEPLLLAA